MVSPLPVKPEPEPCKLTFASLPGTPVQATLGWNFANQGNTLDQIFVEGTWRSAVITLKHPIFLSRSRKCLEDPYCWAFYRPFCCWLPVHLRYQNLLRRFFLLLIRPYPPNQPPHQRSSLRQRPQFLRHEVRGITLYPREPGTPTWTRSLPRSKAATQSNCRT
jgi:hypothetical protein